LFAHLADRPDEELDLAQAALLIAEQEYAGLDVAGFLEQLDALGAEARQRVADVTKPGPREPQAEERLRRVLRFLYEERGFHGNHDDYYDPRNSYLNEVLTRRTGIPITLAVVLIEVLHRSEVEAAGVSFPGHFLVRVPGARGPIFVDPFDGRILDREGLQALHLRVGGEAGDPDPRLLEPVGKRQILIRMLTNLRGIFAARADNRRLCATLEQLEVLAPSPELRREIERLGGEPPARGASRRWSN